jgi:hypothetical protein
VRRQAPLLLIALLAAACGSSAAPRPTHVAQARPTATQASHAIPTANTHPGTAPTTVATSAALPAATPTAGYSAFLATTCHALATASAATISGELPYYQYNSGLRYGTLGDGEGQTGDPGLLSTWLQGSSVRCQFYTPDVAGHGTLLTSGWNQPGGWSLIELDTFGGAWKINDFTFGDRSALYRAMQTSQPILGYHGQ